MKINYPYLPKNKKYLYVKADNIFMRIAKSYAFAHSLDEYMPGCSVIVKGGKILGIGANGSDYHKNHPCKRKELGIPTGQGYELCEGCHPKHHSELAAINDARKHKHSVEGADLYLWGHWWCCRWCWEEMLSSGIRSVFLLKGSEIDFNREAKGNIVGKQFAGLKDI